LFWEIQILGISAEKGIRKSDKRRTKGIFGSETQISQ